VCLSQRTKKPPDVVNEHRRFQRREMSTARHLRPALDVEETGRPLPAMETSRNRSRKTSSFDPTDVPAAFAMFPVTLYWVTETIGSSFLPYADFVNAGPLTWTVEAFRQWVDPTPWRARSTIRQIVDGGLRHGADKLTDAHRAIGCQSCAVLSLRPSSSTGRQMADGVASVAGHSAKQEPSRVMAGPR
jgi:hypothetical protein